jgi:probable rRNA maturation factor
MARKPSRIEVEISDTQAHLRVDRAGLRALVQEALRLEGWVRASISIAVVDDEAMHRINRTHLGHDWPTDVVTFPLSEARDAVLVGEIVVSAETACRAALEQCLDPRDELALYVVHGLLHLCGYDDHSDADVAVMRQREGEVLRAAGIPCGQAAAPHGRTLEHPRESEHL